MNVHLEGGDRLQVRAGCILSGPSGCTCQIPAGERQSQPGTRRLQMSHSGAANCTFYLFEFPLLRHLSMASCSQRQRERKGVSELRWKDVSQWGVYGEVICSVLKGDYRPQEGTTAARSDLRQSSGGSCQGARGDPPPRPSRRCAGLVFTVSVLIQDWGENKKRKIKALPSAMYLLNSWT